jgi:hypothetical protein
MRYLCQLSSLIGIHTRVGCIAFVVFSHLSFFDTYNIDLSYLSPTYTLSHITYRAHVCLLSPAYISTASHPHAHVSLLDLLLADLALHRHIADANQYIRHYTTIAKYRVEHTGTVCHCHMADQHIQMNIINHS